MARYIAFLRAINVGGRTVKMDVLREHFVALGFSNVATVIASGNVVFDSRAAKDRLLERKIEKQLHESLGFEVETFVRSAPELVEVANAVPFDLRGEPKAAVVYVGFLREPLGAPLAKELAALSTANDVVQVAGRELFRLRRERGKAAEEFGIRLDKALKQETTWRNLNTVQRIVETFC